MRMGPEGLGDVLVELGDLSVEAEQLQRESLDQPGGGLLTGNRGVLPAGGFHCGPGEHG
ncbi:hypothetical protein [Streptomyces tailanensis]|uniref:hypothetical protein n=1 Tax=Streptomyces tailanensis TaxID=2569858 RepID=UPI00155A0A57|nr:hypothetical protein [Streptomyces tailanensis]